MKTQKGEVMTLAMISGAVIALALLVSNLVGQVQTLKNASESVAFAGVTVGNEYQATSTAANSVYGAWTTGRFIQTSQKVLGSVVITGANTGVINIYDATTTSILERATTKATSTILVASIPASLVAGTYTFDVQLKDGLYFDLVSGIMPTTTITYR